MKKFKFNLKAAKYKKSNVGFKFIIFYGNHVFFIIFLTILTT